MSPPPTLAMPAPRVPLQLHTNDRDLAFLGARKSTTTRSWANWERAHLGMGFYNFGCLLRVNRQANTLNSEVHRARYRKTGALVALKKIIMHNEKDGVSQGASNTMKAYSQLTLNPVSHYGSSRDQATQTFITSQCLETGGYGS